MEKKKMNIVIYADEEIYQNVFSLFTYQIENEVVHFFDRNKSDVRHISSNKYINYSINSISGYRNISHVIIQKSFYRNKDLIRILRNFKLINPDVKVLVLIDDDPQYYGVLLSLIAKEQLSTVAMNDEDIKSWFFSEGQLPDQSAFIIEKPTKKQWKEFEMY